MPVNVQVEGEGQLRADGAHNRGNNQFKNSRIKIGAFAVYGYDRQQEHQTNQVLT
jgi:hypothetical protein